jgi:Domain of unknown function (DUF1998)
VDGEHKAVVTEPVIADLVREVFSFLATRPDGAPRSEVMNAVRSSYRMDPWLLEPMPNNPKVIRYANVIGWHTVDAVKAGWMKKEPVWRLAESGREALDEYADPVGFWERVHQIYLDKLAAEKDSVWLLRQGGGGQWGRRAIAEGCAFLGYIHRDEEPPVDRCVGCGSLLDAANSDMPQKLFSQTTVRTRRSNRISADEEDRSREGFELSTHYRFAPDEAPRRFEMIHPEMGRLLTITHAPQSTLWQINHGWRRSKDKSGFTIDGETGEWVKHEDDELEAPAPALQLKKPITGVKPYVRDTRNILLLQVERPVFLRLLEQQPPRADGNVAGVFWPTVMTTLEYALQRAIRGVYQVEEDEVRVELVGEDDQQRLLLWEGAEGGTGVWERMMTDSGAFRSLAREALHLTHFDEDGTPMGEWADKCVAACYECLLSYRNQREHRFLDRRAIKEFLLLLAESETRAVADEGRSYDDQYQWLLEHVDPASTFERAFVDFLYEHRLRLPDEAQFRPEDDVFVQLDFYYRRNGVKGTCVFVDGPAHDEPGRAEQDRKVREELEDRGYRVVLIRYDRPMEEQIWEQRETFGAAAGVGAK